MNKKIIAIASAGGHWTQLLRLVPAFNNNKVTFVSTKACFYEKVEGCDYYYVADSNRWNKIALLKSFYDVLKILIKVRPDYIITTGAAPGLMAIIIGRIMGVKTLWIDSIANVNTISMSGKIAIRFANRVYTQWPNLASRKVKYSGNVLSI